MPCAHTLTLIETLFVESEIYEYGNGNVKMLPINIKAKIGPMQEKY